MIEGLAEVDEHLMEKYLEGEKITPDGDLKAAVRAGTIAMKLVPGDLRRVLQEQGRAAAARRGGRLPAVAARHPAGRRASTRRPASRRRARPSDDAPFSALAFKIMNDQLRGPARLPARVLGHARGRAPASTTRRKRQEGARSAACSRCTPTSARRSRRSRRATSPRWSASSDARTGDTLCDAEQADRAGVDGLPGAGDRGRDRAEDARPTRRSSALSLARLALEDPTFRVTADAETGQTLIHGMGELHLEIIVDRLLREFKVEANVGKPQVAYRETIRQKARGPGQVRPADRRPRPVRRRVARGRARRAGQRASCSRTRSWAARSRASTSRRSRRASRRRWRPACSPATRWSTSRSSLTDGCYHEVDSSEMAFKIAGSMGFKEALPQGQARPARAGDGRRGGDARGVHGRGHRRPQQPPRPDRLDGGARGRRRSSAPTCRSARCSATRPTCAR